MEGSAGAKSSLETGRLARSKVPAGGRVGRTPAVVCPRAAVEVQPKTAARPNEVVAVPLNEVVWSAVPVPGRQPSCQAREGTEGRLVADAWQLREGSTVPRRDCIN